MSQFPMRSAPHRYRISVTPIQADGSQCLGRCSIEFEQSSDTSWMSRLEHVQSQRALSGDAGAALVLASALLRNLADIPTQVPGHVVDALQPQLAELLAKLEVLQQPR